MNQNATGVNDHLQQLNNQVIALACVLVPALALTIKVARAEPYEENQSKL